MLRSFLPSSVAAAAVLIAGTSAEAQQATQPQQFYSPASSGNVETVTITAQKLAEARVGIQTQLGASTYTISSDDIKATPGGDNTLLNQVILQAPGAAQDSFGQLHIRGEHNGLQYRLNGIIIPEGISVFGQTLDPRLADSVQLITGALPAEYGDRTAGIIDVRTKTGLFNPGGEISMYGGSHGELAPSLSYGGSAGNFNYFVSGDYLTNTLGIESPDGKNDPSHDRTKQWHGFAYLQDILDQHSSVTAVLGTSNDVFQIPNRSGLQPSGIGGIVGLGPMDPGSGTFVLRANGRTTFPSVQLDERQREITHYAIVSYLRSQGAFDYQVSVFGRYSSLSFTPGANVGDVLYNGLAQTAYKRDAAYGLQVEGAYHFGDTHTIRFGAVYQADDLASNTSSLVLSTAPGSAANPNPNPLCADPANTCQISDVPLSIIDNGTKHAWSYGLYVQDEWKILPAVTINYGLRYDRFRAFDAENQISPRANVVWTPSDTTTIHAGYARYFSPPPIELVAATDIALFDNTTAAASHTDTTPKAERADYYDAGINQTLSEAVSLGLDGFYKASHDLIDEGQFGAPIVLTPFNYRKGRQYGLEFTATYDSGDFSSYLNAAYERADGTNIVSSEFNFSPGDLGYIAAHTIPLDHQQIVSVSAGASYKLREDTRISADLLYGSGLRTSLVHPNDSHVPDYAQVNLGVSHDFKLDFAGGFTARFDVINVFDEKYEIRDGTGVGAGAPQFGPRRGFFVGLSKAL
ncbi:MAG: TonB-dependent receptor, partial [Alphaproteobacteria bacterium]|nr:TonB-dependent receptor [Alphaproteobacteria bacterium]MDE2631407.1 TonB-dependent receptor [Alphaproteobacteria bacterium]